MKILSIDVGIKNLAYCLIEKKDDDCSYNIIKWDVINLCGENNTCTITNCNKIAKYTTPFDNSNDLTAQQYFCKVHSKKSEFIIPTAKLSIKSIKKLKISDLKQILVEYNIPIDNNNTIEKMKKDDILNRIFKFINKNVLTSVTSIKANDFNLISLGISMKKCFDNVLINYLPSIDYILIENQISPIANRMKTLQGMITQYFIMNNKTNIEFISAINKLKGHIDLFETDISTYSARKKEGIKVMERILNDLREIDEKNESWLSHFKHHKKKDDLADAYLQGHWYLNRHKNNTHTL